MTNQITLYVLETPIEFGGQFEGGSINLFATESARDACFEHYKSVVSEYGDKDYIEELISDASCYTLGLSS